MVEVRQKLQSLIESDRLPHALAIVGGSTESRLELGQWLASRLDCDVNHGSLLQIEPDGVQIKLEQARSILEFLSLTRLAKSRLIVVSEAHHMNPQAANALLKIVEEPPENSYFALLVPSFSLLMPTLRSRTQVFRLPFAKAAVDSYDPELIKVVEQALGGLQKRERSAWSELVDHVKDRETALQVAQICQRTLRNAVVDDFTQSRHLLWWRAAFQLELDILANMDRTLLFENFYYQAHR